MSKREMSLKQLKEVFSDPFTLSKLKKEWPSFFKF